MGMVRNIVVPGILLIFASPVLAASGPFFSLRNTDFVVLISFIFVWPSFDLPESALNAW